MIDNATYRGKSNDPEAIINVLEQCDPTQSWAIMGHLNGIPKLGLNFGKYYTSYLNGYKFLIRYLLRDDLEIVIAPCKLSSSFEYVDSDVFKEEYKMVLRLYNNDYNKLVECVSDNLIKEVLNGK